MHRRTAGTPKAPAEKADVRRAAHDTRAPYRGPWERPDQAADAATRIRVLPLPADTSGWSARREIAAKSIRIRLLQACRAGKRRAPARRSVPLRGRGRIRAA